MSNMGFNFTKLSVLVVEDILPMRKLIASVLEALGVGNIYIAANGEDAFRIFCEEKPDIVISDWEMKPMNGIDLVSEIRNNPASPNRVAPVILVTGYSALPRIQTARDTGITEFLTKPFTASDIANRIASVINRPRDFVDAPDSYFGPDRRRNKNLNYDGPFRRVDDTDKTDILEIDFE